MFIIVTVPFYITITFDMGEFKFSNFLYFHLTGAGMSFVACGAFGFAFGQEVANHWLQLYRLDTLGAQTKFMEWWERKAEGRS